MMFLGQDATPLSLHDVLTAEDCIDIGQRVTRLQPHWRARSNNGYFFSLGAAAYLDATEHYSHYLDLARQDNPTLLGAFPDLYRRITGFFEDFLGEPVSLETDRAVPGFHIFVLRGRNHAADDPAPRAHFDLQWQLAYPDRIPTGTLSFTLLIDQPSSGADLALWPLRYQEAVLLGKNSREYASTHAPRRVDYAPGRLAVFDGLILHAIGSVGEGSAVGRRVTLQGHAVRFDHEWQLYW